MRKKETVVDYFSSKKTIPEAALLQGLTDIHSHYLPGVDDGFQEKKDAVEALEEMVRLGVRRVYFTPHIMADLPKNHPAFLKERFDLFVKEAPSTIELRLAGEYMLDAAFFDQEKEGFLTIGKNHVLIEMSYMYASPELENIIYDLQIKDYVPLLAHPERYMFMDERKYRSVKRKGCRFQLNILSLSGQYGRRAQDVAWFLLQHGMYDFVGTDIHHLNVFLHNMKRLKLSTKEQELLRKLIRQNDLLW